MTKVVLVQFTGTVVWAPDRNARAAPWTLAIGLAGEGAVVIVAARRLEAAGVEQCSVWEQGAEFYGQKTVERRNLPSA